MAIVNGHTAVESLVHFHARLRITDAIPVGLDLETMLEESHRVIRANRSLVLKTKDRGRLYLQRTIDGPSDASGYGKPAVVAFQELGQPAIGGARCVDRIQAELHDKTILKGSKQPLDAAFRLWGSRRY